MLCVYASQWPFWTSRLVLEAAVSAQQRTAGSTAVKPAKVCSHTAACVAGLTVVWPAVVVPETVHESAVQIGAAL